MLLIAAHGARLTRGHGNFPLDVLEQVLVAALEQRV